ncbi:MAG: LexA family transcriptional regulator, partial [Clostridia bacterium]|nr:LexA family transcriptional regulator [Clostridia bacterium]
RQDSANNGEIAVVLLENETTLKRFFREKDRAVLKAENDDYEDIVISGDQLGTILIQGVAVKVIKDLK